MFAIYKRELRSYFTSPIGYVFVATYLALSGFVFAYSTVLMSIEGNSADVSLYFTILIYSFSLLLPLLTMRSFADDRRMKTEQLLLTSPVSIFGMVSSEVSRGLHNFCRYIRRFMSGLCASLYLQRHKRSRCRKKRCNPCRLFHCSSSFGRRIYSDRYFRFIAYKTSNHRCNRNYRNITFLPVLQYDKQCNFILSDSRPL